MIFNVCLRSGSFLLRADWLKYDSSDVVANSPSFSLPTAREPRRTFSQAMKLALKYQLRTLVFFTSYWRRDRHFAWSSESAQRFSHLQARAKAVPLFPSPAPGIKVTISRSALTSTLLAELFIFFFLIILFLFGLFRFILTTGLLQPREVLSENVFLVLQPTISYNWCSSIQYVRVSFRKQFSGL